MPARRHRNRFPSILLLALAAWLPAAAQAALGEPADSVLGEHAALDGAALTRSSVGGLAVLESITRDGVAVRQFVSPQGIVFAAAWSGPALPNLKVLLGQHYARYAADLYTGAAGPKLHTIRSGDLVLQLAKLPRGFSGSAYVPALLPPGVNVDAIR